MKDRKNYIGYINADTQISKALPANLLELARKFNPSVGTIGIGYGGQSLPVTNAITGEFTFGQVLIDADSLQKDNGLFLEVRYIRELLDSKTGKTTKTNLSMALPGDSGGGRLFKLKMARLNSSALCNPC